MMQKYTVFLISGGTGFIGSALVNYLLAAGKKVYVLTRSIKTSDNKNLIYIQWDVEKKTISQSITDLGICVVHLAGANVAGKRWSATYLNEIIESRTKSTSYLWELINNKTIPTAYFIGASATGYYGENNAAKLFTETDKPATDFLATTCVAWEQAVHENNIEKTPVCIFRIGMVLGANGGAVPQFLNTLPIAGIPGSGSQMYPWVHLQDVHAAMLHAAENTLIGTYNLVSPEVASAKQIITALARANGKFFIAIPSPRFAIKLILGKFSTEVLKSVSVSAQKLLDTNFIFKFASLKTACEQILNETKKTSN